jgi:hypothetical protein
MIAIIMSMVITTTTIKIAIMLADCNSISSAPHQSNFCKFGQVVSLLHFQLLRPARLLQWACQSYSVGAS